MTDGGYMLTSDITRRLRHNTSAVTRNWIWRKGIEAQGRDTETGEKRYLTSDVEQAIAGMRHGRYRRAQPDA